MIINILMNIFDSEISSKGVVNERYHLRRSA